MYDLMSIANDLIDMMNGEGVELQTITKISYGRKNMRCWGKCETYDERSFEIKINPVLGDERNPVHELEETLLHELIHTVKGCFNHGERFKMIGRKFDNYGFHVSRLSSKNLKVDVENRYKYTLTCECGHSWNYKRAGRVVKEHKNCTCPYCDSKGKFTLNVNY